MQHNLLRSLACALIVVLVTTPLVWAHDSGFGLARYEPDGVLDRSFGSDGVVVIRSAVRGLVANALALQPDGKIVIAGMTSDLSTASIQLAIARYNPDGSPDTDFSTAGVVTTPVGAAGAQASAVALQPDGRILIVGNAFSHGAADDEFLIARYLADGTPDTRFGTDGITTTHVGAAGSAAQAVALQPDGRIVVVGTAFSNGATDDDFALTRYTPNGSLDHGFGASGIVTTDFGSGEGATNASLDRAGAVGLQSDGKIVVAGVTRGQHQSFAVARYDPDGSLDSGFGAGGKALISAIEPHVYALIVYPSGDLVVAGSTGSVGGKTAPFALIRLHADGQPDERFGSGGLVSTSLEGSRSGVRAVVAQADGKLLTGGAKFGAPSAQGDAVRTSGFAVARYNADGSVDDGFGNGGKALTDMGDAGAVPLSLAVQPDGKIIAAGLVFFQTPGATPTSPLAAVLPFAAPGAGAIVLVVISALMLRTRRGNK